MLCQFQRTSRPARLRDLVALVYWLLALALFLADPREPLRQRPADSVQIGILECSEASLNGGKVASAGLKVQTVYLDTYDSPKLGARLYDDQGPRHLQALLAAPYQVERQEGS